MLDDLIAEANEAGWLLNNLFQLSDGSFRANLRSDTHATLFGEGQTPEEALASALTSAIVPIATPKLTFSRAPTLREVLNIRTQPLTRRKL